MSEKKMKPEIRFKGFTDDWEERKLGEMAETFEYGLNAAAIDYDGINKYIRITDIDDETREFSTVKLTSPGTNLEIADNYKLKEGDLLFARTGASVGKTYHYKVSDGLVYYAGFLIRARIKPEYDIEFVFQNSLTNEYNNFIRLTSQRSGQPGVNAQEYSVFKLMAPKLSEQSKIGTFFKYIDHIITLHQRKYHKLVTMKKSMLEKMFPKNGSDVPEIRFKGFNEAWEEKELGKISDVTKLAGFEFTKYVVYSDEGTIIALRGLNVKNGNIILADVKYIDQSDFSKLNRSKLFKDDILLTYVGTVGELAIIPEDNKYYLAPNVARIRLINGINSQFVIQMMGNKTYYDKIIFPLIATSSQPALSMENVRKFILKLPRYEEQNKIGTYFKRLDTLTTLHQRELEKLKNIKKACLEKMFV